VERRPPTTQGAVSPGSEHGCLTPCQEVGDASCAGRGGVNVLIEFLANVLEACGRAAESLRRPRKHARSEEEEAEAEQRAEVRLQLLQTLFVDTAMISHLFKLLPSPTAQFESATLLHAVLQNLLDSRCCFSSALTEPLLSQYLPHIEVLGTLLMRVALSRAEGSLRRPHEQQRGPRREVRLNAYKVREPLGPLRVAAVQILAALCDLAPGQVLPLVKPAVWGLLAQWFLSHRCNHIFQAACGRLWISVVQHGSVSLQHLVLVKLHLLGGLCDAVLAEGSCGDRWQELRAEQRGLGSVTSSGGGAGPRAEKARVAVRKIRHPGGLGGIVPVLVALADKAAAEVKAATEVNVAAEVEVKEALEAAPPSLPPAERQLLAERQPLAERTVSQAMQCAMKPLGDAAIAAKHLLPPSQHLARLLATTPLWPQVLGALGSPGEGNLEGRAAIGGA